MIQVPISIGELFDKTSILSIKKEKVRDPQKMVNVLKEYNLLFDMITPYLISNDNCKILYNHIKRINEKLWNIEDEIRKLEAKQEFNEDFIKLARKVYTTNDIRFDYKNAINELFDSEIREVKEYVKYK